MKAHVSYSLILKNMKLFKYVFIIFLTAAISGGSVYLLLQNKQSAAVVNKTNIVEYDSMSEYVDEVAKTNLIPAFDMVRVEINGTPRNVSTTGASAPVYVYAQPNWENQNPKNIQIFYLQFVNPMFDSKNPKVAQEFWAGPFYGKLKQLVQDK